ncbi:MAG TPA: hypothetical protein PKD92_01340 [Novosphingobium sp.]|nr:hypothetical protein [Novosphingobium sp.]
MSWLLVLAAAAASPVIPSEDPDLHCMVAYLYASGTIEAEASEAEKAQVASLVTYYLGKLHGRFPGQSAEAALRVMVSGPGFDGETIQRDVLRCNAEVERWSADLAAVGSGAEPPHPAAN